MIIRSNNKKLYKLNLCGKSIENIDCILDTLIIKVGLYF